MKSRHKTPLFKLALVLILGGSFFAFISPLLTAPFMSQPAAAKISPAIEIEREDLIEIEVEDLAADPLSQPLQVQQSQNLEDVPEDGEGLAGEGLAIVAKVDGLIDGIVADFIEESIQNAEKENALILVLQINSPNVVISASRFEQLRQSLINAPLPIASWVGPSGARATGKVAELISLTNPVGMAPGARIGNTDSYPGLENRTVGYTESLELGIVNFETPTIGDLLIQIEGFESKEVLADEDCVIDCLIRLEPVSRVRFTRLSFLDQAFHAIASPPIAYLLFGFGLALIVLEYYTAGVGISGVIGASAFLFGTYGLIVLPTNFWACLLLILGIFGFAIDVQTGVPRVWTLIGIGAYLTGSLFLYHSGISLSWILLLIGPGGMALTMIGALPALVRSRFTTPTIGREWMIGEMGSVVEKLNPDGIVKINQALWRARTWRASPIQAGEKVKITGIQNLMLEVDQLQDESEKDKDRADIV